MAKCPKGWLDLPATKEGLESGIGTLTSLHNIKKVKKKD